MDDSATDSTVAKSAGSTFWAVLPGNNTLRLSADAYDAGYFSPAFALLDKPDTCAVEGPKVLPLVEFLIGLGGSRDPN